MILSKTVLWVASAIFLGIGVLFTIHPESLVVFRENPLASADARVEIRAVYGGIELALGVFFAMAARNEGLRRGGLIAAALVSSFAGIARFFGILVERDMSLEHFVWGALEVVGGIVAFFALFREQAEDDEGTGTAT